MTGPIEEEGSTNELVNASPVRSIQCHTCQRSFGRLEHLTRHVQSHRQERAFQCYVCRKGFYRVDALRRHEQVHENSKGSQLRKGARACIACSAARRRCTGGECCSACQKRSLECVYPRSNRDRQAVLSDESVSMASVSSGSDSIERAAGADNRENFPAIGNMSSSWQTTANSPQVIEHLEHSTRTSPSDPSASTFGDSSLGSNISHNVQTSATSTVSSNFMSSRVQGSDEATALVRPALGQNENVMLESPQFHDDAHTSRDYLLHQNNSPSINWLYDKDIYNFEDLGQGGLDIDLLYNATSRQINHAQTSLRHSTQPQEELNSGISYSAASNPHYDDSPRLPLLEQPISVSDRLESTDHVSRKKIGTGYYYVDGDGARLPHVSNRRIRRSSRSTSFSTPASQMDISGQEYGPYVFPNEPDFSNLNSISSLPRFKGIDSNTYDEICKSFNQTCVHSSHFILFNTASFPSIQILNHFLRCYFESFQPILPFIHPGTFEKSHWLMILALAAIGSHYFEFDNAEIYEIAMHEFLRRAIDTVAERNDFKNNDVLLVQIKLLSCIGMMYCGDEHLLQISNRYHADLVTYCRNTWNKETANPDPDTTKGVDEVTTDWKKWSEGESIRRTGYCIWLLDCMRVFHFQLPAMLSLEDAKVALPCQEVLWEADTPLIWQQIYSCSTGPLLLSEAIRLVYVEKRLQPSMGELSRILLIHAIYRRTWEVGHYFRQPLALWAPCADRKDDESFQDSGETWLPGIPTYAKWRNSACDCLDVLHWHANSVIGAASGMEHPTVLHLHLARVVLLTPFREITKLARLLTDEDSATKQAEILSTRKHIHRWATEDHYKSRLAMIHAGVLFWHVRRYPTDGFYEPSSVFLATLALWAYGSFSKTAPTIVERVESPSSDSGAEASVLTSIQLDRPADDELVQLFVKRGASMKAKVLGVGNICGVKGPERVLVAGRKLLINLKCWGISREYVAILRNLENHYRDRAST